jgi:hypothetical protein
MNKTSIFMAVAVLGALSALTSGFQMASAKDGLAKKYLEARIK